MVSAKANAEGESSRQAASVHHITQIQSRWGPGWGLTFDNWVENSWQKLNILAFHWLLSSAPLWLPNCIACNLQEEWMHNLKSSMVTASWTCSTIFNVPNFLSEGAVSLWVPSMSKHCNLAHTKPNKHLHTIGNSSSPISTLQKSSIEHPQSLSSPSDSLTSYHSFIFVM